MLIGELARRSGLTRDTVRFYERAGLIQSSPKQAGSRVYNDFSPEMVERLAFIRQGQAVGYTLREIKLTLDEWGTDLDKAPPAEIIAAVEAKLEDVESKIAQLEKIRCYLQDKLERFRTKQREEIGSI